MHSDFAAARLFLEPPVVIVPVVSLHRSPTITQPKVGAERPEPQVPFFLTPRLVSFADARAGASGPSSCENRYSPVRSEPDETARKSPLREEMQRASNPSGAGGGAPWICRHPSGRKRWPTTKNYGLLNRLATHNCA